MPSLIFVLIAPILPSSFSPSVLVQLVLWNYIRKCKTTLKIVKIICVCSYITDLAPPVRFELTTYRFIPPLSLRYAESSILGVQPSRLCLPTASALLKRLTDRSSEHQKNLGQFPKFVLCVYDKISFFGRFLRVCRTISIFFISKNRNFQISLCK